jgi:hypothetical protein
MLGYLVAEKLMFWTVVVLVQAADLGPCPSLWTHAENRCAF